MLALLVAGAIGASSAWFALDEVADKLFIANGAWRIVPQSAAQGLYARAAIARFDLMMPARADELRLTAMVDETGRPLDSRCTYWIAGDALPAEGWSVSAYGPKHLLIPNHQERYAITDAVAREDGSFKIVASPSGEGDAWLPLDSVGAFSLVLRLRGSDERALADPQSFNAPRIVRESCQ